MGPSSSINKVICWKIVRKSKWMVYCRAWVAVEQFSASQQNSNRHLFSFNRPTPELCGHVADGSFVCLFKCRKHWQTVTRSCVQKCHRSNCDSEFFETRAWKSYKLRSGQINLRKLSQAIPQKNFSIFRLINLTSAEIERTWLVLIDFQIYGLVMKRKRSES